MNVGIGLPSTVPGFSGRQIIDWARKADERGFSSLGTIDRLVYGNADPLIALAAAAGVTERIRLTTSILIPTFRGNGAVLAKQAASLNHISGGRLVLGLAPGAREDDFASAGESFSGRGRRFEAILDELNGVWADDSIGPTGRPELIIGGGTAVAHRRAAEYGEGWIAGGTPPEMFAQAALEVRKAWEAAGRRGRPRLLALAYFALGPEAERNARDYLLDYYAWLGDMASMIAGSALTNEEAVRGARAAFEEAGCGELLFMPADADPEQVDRLADALG